MKTPASKPTEPALRRRVTVAFRAGRLVQAMLMAAVAMVVIMQLVRTSMMLVFRYGGF